MYGGRTVEVLNTDAEGRLVLADALVRATEAKPDVILDVATLTGAMVVALGDKVAGVLGSEEIVQAVLAAGESAGEEQWPMPIPEEMDERIHSSKIADLAQHDWTRWGGGLFAAAFLREFTAGLPWAHLDIAGPGVQLRRALGPRHLGRHRLRGRHARGLRPHPGLTCHFRSPEQADLSLPVLQTRTCHFRSPEQATCHFGRPEVTGRWRSGAGRTRQRSPRSFLRRL